MIRSVFSKAASLFDRPAVSPADATVDLGNHYQLGLDPKPLRCGEHVVTPAVLVAPESSLTVGISVETGTLGKLEVLVEQLASTADGWKPLAAFPLETIDGERVVDLSLSRYSGLAIRAMVRRDEEGSGPASVHLLRIAPRHLAGKVNALASYDLRMRNEVSHFSGDAYTHEMYGGQPGPSTQEKAAVRLADVVASADVERFSDVSRQRIATALAGLTPNPGEVAFNFALRALGALLPMQPPNFFARAARMREKRPLKLLSILSGAARIEEQLLAHCGDGAELTLIDASPDLIERAAARLKASHPGARIDCMVGDINRGLPGAGRHDVILCVSALHHVANLEDVLSQINARLEDDGEFWSIGEQIGRNGNRLWPEALVAANAAFAALPERLRRNAHTGSIDKEVSDHDFSTGCFEGIRSEELETMLEAHFIPDHVYKRNAFLWRLVDATYSDNFALEDEDDLRHLKDLVAAEAMHWVAGGRSTELHGVYRKKRIAGAG